MMSEDERSKLWYYNSLNETLVSIEDQVHGEINREIDLLLALEDDAMMQTRMFIAGVAAIGLPPGADHNQVAFGIFAQIKILRGVSVHLIW
jgi:hypothetical protein